MMESSDRFSYSGNEEYKIECEENILFRDDVSVHEISSDSSIEICEPESTNNTLNTNNKIHDMTKCVKHTCFICGKEFLNTTNFEIHLKEHNETVMRDILKINNEKKYVCDKCGSSFVQEKVLKRHIVLVHLSTGSLKCKVCSKRFKRRTDLERHVEEHQDKRPFACDLCDKNFKRMYHLNRHKLTHARNNKEFF